MIPPSPEVWLALSLICLNFVVKFVVGRDPGWVNLGETVAELPRDISLQSTAFILAFVVSALSSLSSLSSASLEKQELGAIVYAIGLVLFYCAVLLLATFLQKI